MVSSLTVCASTLVLGTIVGHVCRVAGNEAAETEEIIQMSAFVQLLQGPGNSRSRIGDWAILAFLLTQGTDGALTYVGMTIFGPEVEANPVIAQLVAVLGVSAGLIVAKAVAMMLGVLLHLTAVHRVVLALTAVYLTTAIGPWTLLLFAS